MQHLRSSWQAREWSPYCKCNGKLSDTIRPFVNHTQASISKLSKHSLAKKKERKKEVVLLCKKKKVAQKYYYQNHHLSSPTPHFLPLNLHLIIKSTVCTFSPQAPSAEKTIYSEATTVQGTPGEWLPDVSTGKRVEHIIIHNITPHVRPFRPFEL